MFSSVQPHLTQGIAAAFVHPIRAKVRPEAFPIKASGDSGNMFDCHTGFANLRSSN